MLVTQKAESLPLGGLQTLYTGAPFQVMPISASLEIIFANAPDVKSLMGMHCFHGEVDAGMSSLSSLYVKAMRTYTLV